MVFADRARRRLIPLGFTVVLLLGTGCRMVPFQAPYRDPLTAAEHIDLGLAYEQQGKYEAAAKQYRAALDRRTSSTAWFNLGNAEYHQGNLQVAEEAWKEALQMDDKNADAMNNLAWLYAMQGRELEEAERLVRRAIELKPKQRPVYDDTLAAVQAAHGVSPKK